VLTSTPETVSPVSPSNNSLTAPRPTMVATVDPWILPSTTLVNNPSRLRIATHIPVKTVSAKLMDQERLELQATLISLLMITTN